MYDAIDYEYITTDNTYEDKDVIINSYYSQSEICELCAPLEGSWAPDYIVVKNEKEDFDETVSYNMEYSL